MIPWIAISISSAVVVFWLWVFIFNPKDVLGLTRQRQLTSFDPQAIVQLRSMLSRLVLTKAILTGQTPIGYRYQEAFSIGLELSKIATTLADGKLQVERFCGRILEQAASRFRRVRSSEGNLLISVEIVDGLIANLEALLHSIDSQDVEECYQSLTNILFIAANGISPGPLTQQTTLGVRKQFVKEIRTLVTTLFQNREYEHIVLFLERWIEIIHQKPDTRVYFFLEFLQMLKDRLFSFPQDRYSSANYLLSLKMQRWVVDFTRAMTREDLVNEYHAMANLVTAIQIATEGVQQEVYIRPPKDVATFRSQSELKVQRSS